MNQGQKPMLAACGLECLDCDIRLVPSDPEAAERVVASLVLHFESSSAERR